MRRRIQLTWDAPYSRYRTPPRRRAATAAASDQNLQEAESAACTAKIMVVNADGAITHSVPIN